MGYRTPNIDRIADEGALFTDYYGEQSCTAGRAAFITGQNPYRSGLTKVGLPGSPIGLQAEVPTIAKALKAHGYATGQFGKNHFGDRDEHLPTVHGFDEFFGNLYHLNAEEEPELDDYPPEADFPNFRKNFGPRGVIHSWANGDGTQRIEDTGPLTKERMKTIDDERDPPQRVAVHDRRRSATTPRSSPGSTRRTCTSARTSKTAARARPDVGNRSTTTRCATTTSSSASCWTSSMRTGSPRTRS